MPAAAPITWQSPGKTISAMMRSNAFVRGIMGPYGSAKSTTCIMEILRRAREQRKGPDGKRHSRWAIIRNTYPELNTTTIKTWHQWVSPSIGRWVAQGPPTHYINDSEIEMEVMFLALDKPDDVAKLLSMELTGAWVNEAREIPRGVLDGLTGRVGRYPSRLMGGCSWYGVIMDTNPPDSDHWWYKMAEEIRPAEWEFYKQPGGLTPEAENVENLPQGYYSRIAAGKDPDWIDVYVNGNYGFVREGKPVYPEYRDNIHCKEFGLNDKLPMYIGIDFGLTPAAVFGQRTIMGAWRWDSELVTEDMGAVRFSELLAATMRQRYPWASWATITGDPAGDQRAQSDESTPFMMLKKAGIPARPAPSNDFNQRRESVAVALSRLTDGEPGLLIHPQAKMLRKGMAGAYNYKRVQVSGAEVYRDVPDKGKYSHVCEAGQYLMMGAGEGRALVSRVPYRGARNVTSDTDYDMLAH